MYMKQFLLLMTALIALSVQGFAQQDENFRSTAPAPGPAPKIELGESVQYELDNGLKVIVVENTKLPRVSFQIFVDAPSIMEGEVAGFVGMSGEMLSRGTASRTKAELDYAIDFMGASMSTSSSGVSGTCLTKHQDGLLEIMADVLFNPSFPEEEFDKLKTQTISGLATVKDDANAIASNVGSVLRYGKDHPYGSVQTEASTDKITLDICKAYYQMMFKPNISYFITVGDIRPEEAKALAEKYFGAWEPGEVPKPVYETPKAPEKTQVCFVDKAGAVQSVIDITYPVDLKPNSPDLVKASVMNTLLGGYFLSRINNNLREDKGYTYGARSSLSPDRLVGSFRAIGSFRNEVSDSAVHEFLYEIDRLRNEPVGAEELSLVQNYVSGTFAQSLESPQTIARFALNTVRYELDKDYYANYLKRVSAVTSADIQEMAKRYLHPEQAYILVVGNKPEVAKTLTRFDSDERVRLFDIYGNPISEGGLELPDGITAQQVIDDYIKAIGGKKRLDAVKSLRMVMEANSPMGKLTVTNITSKPNKLSSSMAMGGSVMQRQVFDGESGKVTSMGQEVPLGEDDIEEMKYSGQMFPELNYFADGYEVVLDGLEMVEGQKAFKLLVKLPNDKKSTEYYSMETGLKIREVSVIEQGPQTVTITQDFIEYSEVEGGKGLKVPSVISVSGMFPVPLKMNLISAELNPKLDPDTFK